jgi:DNA end-binding protein Ku
LFVADEIRDPRREIGNLPGRVDLSAREAQMASQLIDAMTGPWNPADYRDAYTDRVSELIEAKKNKKEFEPAAPAPAATDLTDSRKRCRPAWTRPGNPEPRSDQLRSRRGAGAA